MQPPGGNQIQPPRILNCVQSDLFNMSATRDIPASRDLEVALGHGFTVTISLLQSIPKHCVPTDIHTQFLSRGILSATSHVVLLDVDVVSEAIVVDIVGA